MTSSGAAINNPHDLSIEERITAEINEVFLNQELIKKKTIIKNKNMFELEILIPKIMVQTEKDISILINISLNYPKEPPEVLCLTEFLYPNICDGRNLISDILNGNDWNVKDHNIDFLINKIPKFIINFIEQRKKNTRLVVGSFYLNKLYHINRLKELPIFFHLITQKEKKLQIKTVKTAKILMISDISFCLFELDSKNSGYCKLVFNSDLKNLINTKINEKKNEIEIKWKSTNKNKKEIKIEIISPIFKNINKLLINNFKKFDGVKDSNIENNNTKKDTTNKDIKKNNNIKNNGKDYSKEIHDKGINKDDNIKSNDKDEQENSTQNNNPERNENNKNNSVKRLVPNINIEMIEKQIFYVEKSMNVNGNINKDQIKYLTTLYQKCIEYYSAIENRKANDYKNKIGVLTGQIYISNEKEKDNINERKEDSINEKNVINVEKSKEEIKITDENTKVEKNLENEKLDFDFGNDFNTNFNLNENDANNINKNTNLNQNLLNEINYNPNNETKEIKNEENNVKVNNINNSSLKDVEKKDTNKEKKVQNNDNKETSNNTNEEKINVNNNNQIHLKVMNEGEEIGTLDVGSDDEDD